MHQLFLKTFAHNHCIGWSTLFAVNIWHCFLFASSLICLSLWFCINAGNFSITERITAKYAGAAAMYFVSKRLKKKHNITDERATLYEAADTWVDALDGRDFLGSTPVLIILFCADVD